mgnify:CR=1 FL=1
MQTLLQEINVTEQAQVVTIDGTEYKSNELSQEQIRLFNKVSKWQQQVISLRDSLEDAQDLYNTNYNKLKTSLNNSKEK